jgi:hypothetical protein
MSLVLLGSTSGSVTLQEPAIAGSTVIDLPATSGTMAVLPTATSVLPQASGGTGTTTGYYGFKNRIINGAMVIDQRNAGASVNNTTVTQYSVDRWAFSGSAATKFSAQQSSVAPDGFTKSLVCTSLSAYSVGASEFFAVNQRIEGFNISDLGWGTASAATVTLSFWVRSSLTGSFGGSFSNYAGTVSYPFSYTILTANTWEQKSITIAGPTTGTFPTDNSGSAVVAFSLGAGATVSGSAGAWTGSLLRSATGATSVVSTNGATFYITGVQLEKGSTATSFDYRPYGTELMLCQRYLPAFNATAISQSMPSVGYGTSSINVNATYIFNVTARVAPTGISVNNATYFSVSDGVTNTTCTSTGFTASSVNSCIVGFSVASGITQYRPYTPYANNATAQLLFTGCEL